MRLGHLRNIRIEVMLRGDVSEVNRIRFVDYVLGGVDRRLNVMEVVRAVLLEKLLEFGFDR